MKTSQRILTTLAAAFAGQYILVADTPPEPPVPPPVPEAATPAVEEAAMAEVQHQLSEVQHTLARDLAHAQHAVMLAQAGKGEADELEVDLEVPEPPEPPEPPEIWGIGHNMAGLSGFGLGDAGASVSPLVIAATSPEPTTVAETQEDLAIMARILSKAAARGSESGDPMALGIMLSTFPGLRRPQAMHLDGYGAVFLVNVSFPLAAPAAKTESKPEKPVNTTWEQARRELYGQKGSPRYGARVGGDVFAYSRSSGKKPVAFDADRVERVKRDLVDALKNGANLRHVKPEENLVVVVTSPAGERPLRVVKTEIRRSTGGGGGGGGGAVGGVGGGAVMTHEEAVPGDGPAAATTMVLRVKKGEADEFAAGKLEPDEFRKRVAVTVY